MQEPSNNITSQSTYANATAASNRNNTKETGEETESDQSGYNSVIENDTGLSEDELEAPPVYKTPRKSPRIQEPVIHVTEPTEDIKSIEKSPRIKDKDNTNVERNPSST